jgi:hypothetical protein
MDVRCMTFERKVREHLKHQLERTKRGLGKRKREQAQAASRRRAKPSPRTERLIAATESEWYSFALILTPTAMVHNRLVQVKTK